MNPDTPDRSLPPVHWDGMSLQQIWAYLNPAESEEDVYRVADRFGEWADVLDDRSREHRRRWTEADDGTGSAHLAAVAFSTATGSELTAGIDDLQRMRSSLEKLTVTFVEVRRKIQRLYDEAQAAREALLDWVLAGDDEDNELIRRDNTQAARDLMRQYEQTTNAELREWPAAGRPPTSTATYAADNATTTIPVRDDQNPAGDDSPTKPTRLRPHGEAGAAAFPGAARAFGDADVEHHNHVVQPEDGLFDDRTTISPPVIDADFTFERDEDE